LLLHRPYGSFYDTELQPGHMSAELSDLTSSHYGIQRATLKMRLAGYFTSGVADCEQRASPTGKDGWADTKRNEWQGVPHWSTRIFQRQSLDFAYLVRPSVVHLLQIQIIVALQTRRSFSQVMWPCVSFNIRHICIFSNKIVCLNQVYTADHVPFFVRWYPAFVFQNR